MFSFRLQSSYIRECPELGCNLLDVVLMFISKCHTKSSIDKLTPKTRHMEKFLPLYSWDLNHVIQLYAYSLHDHVTTIQMQLMDFTPKTKNMN